MILSYYVSVAIKYHVYCSRFFICFSVPLTILFEAVLSVATGVGGCGWPNFDRAALMDVAFWQFINNFPDFDSMADTMKFLIMLHSTCTRPFWGGIVCICVLDFGPRIKYPPVLFCASGSDI